MTRRQLERAYDVQNNDLVELRIGGFTPNAAIFNVRERQGEREVESPNSFFILLSSFEQSPPKPTVLAGQGNATGTFLGAAARDPRAFEVDLPDSKHYISALLVRGEVISGSQFLRHSNTHPVCLRASSTVFFLLSLSP